MMQWAALGAKREFIRLWGDRALVFNVLSGKTHDLNGVAAEALLQIIDAPCSSEDIAAGLASLLEVPSDDVWQESIRKFVNELADLGLIAPLES